MKYVVIGSNSFSGGYLIDELLKDPRNLIIGVSRSLEKSALYLPYKRSLITLSRDRFSFQRKNVVNDIDDLVQIIDAFRPDYIINYAAQTEVYQSSLTPVSYFETNTLAVVRLCHKLSQRSYLKRYIHISSAEIYGSSDFPVRELTPPRPTTPYAVSKLAADFYLLALHKHCGFPVIIIRSTNVYGKHQQLHKIIPRSVIRLIQGNPIELHDGGRFIRPFIHARDACRGVIATIEKGTIGNIYNFSTDCNLSIGDVVRLICRKMGNDFESFTVSVKERTGHDFCYWLDYSKAEAELDWSPKISLEEGIDEVITWIKENWEEIQKEPLTYIHKE